MYFHRDPITVRLGKLAGSGRTGALRVQGDHGGAVYLRGGVVVYAESGRTPGPADPGGPLEREFAVREATVDAALELLTDRARYRFREGEAPGVEQAAGLPVPVLLAEVRRRQEIVRQLSTVVTADTMVVRNPHFGSPSVQVSALQWALLSRMGDRTTPRELALKTGHGVFGTTVEAFRLVVLRLLAVVGVPAPPAGGTAQEQPDPRRGTLSFLRAVL